MEFITNEYKFKSASGLCDIYAQSAAPDDFGSVKGVVQIAHGMAEHSNRYARFAMELCKNGYAVYINDHLGHGTSVATDDELGFFGDNGDIALVEDMKQLSDIAMAEYPDLPFFVFGHSMGSFLARAYAAKYGSNIDGLVLSGTAGANPAAAMGIKLANYFEKTEGKLYRSELLDSIAFGKYNKKTAKKTKFDWLSRDEKEVEKYIDDPYCGFVFTANGFKTLFTLLKNISSNKWYKSVPTALQIMMISGENDPVGEYGKGVTSVYRDLRKTGHTNTYLKLYPEARHEILNEINKDEVMADIIMWLDDKTMPSKDDEECKTDEKTDSDI
ncbi:MAG: alpha/beta hydrolase [Oscillospiraceae bacterium]